jgi:hypothetical protein
MLIKARLDRAFLVGGGVATGPGSTGMMRSWLCRGMMKLGELDW